MKIFKSFKIILIFNILSKILGVIREIFLAYSFGTSYIVDAYRIAIEIILFPLHIFFGENINSSLVYIIKRHKHMQIINLVNKIIVFSIFTMFILGIAIFFLKYKLIAFIAPGFNDKTINLTAQFLIYMLPGSFFYIISNILVTINLSNGNVYLFSIRAFLLNFINIIFIMLAYYTGDIIYLSYYFTIFNILYFFIIIFHFKTKQNYSFSYKNTNKKLQKFFFSNYIIVTTFLFVSHVSIFFDRYFSSLAGVGNIAGYEYARFITDTFSVLIGSALGYSFLANIQSKEDLFHLENKLLPFFKITFLASVFLSINAELIIKILFERNQFDSDSIEIVKNALIGLSIGLSFGTLNYVYSKILIALGMISHLVILNIIATFFNIALSLYTYKIWGIFGITLSTSLSMIILFLLYQYIFFKNYIKNNLIIQFLYKTGTLMFFYVFIIKYISITNIYIDLAKNSILFILFFSLLIKKEYKIIFRKIGL